MNSFLRTFTPILSIIAVAWILLWGITSCKLGPNYERTIAVDSVNYRQQFPDGESIANIPWWDMFQDTTLAHLIATALENNNNLQTAIARLSEARASMSMVRADLYPRVNYSIDGSSTVTTANNTFTNEVTAAIGVSYQVDLWGKIRRSTEAALQEYLATEEAYRALTITLISELATSYLILRDLDNRLIISEETEKTWQSNYDIVQARFKGGFVSEVDLNQAKIQLTEAQAAIQTFIRLRAQTENAISVIIGVPPNSIPRGELLTDQVFPPDLPAGIPSELLDRRPDVLVAERSLHAQTARIGVAEALKYPSLTLTPALGAQLTNPTLAFADLSAQILGPIFNNGFYKRRVEVEKARTEQLLQSYEGTFLNALREVEDAMIAVLTYENELTLRTEQVKAAEDAARLSWIRYEGGLTSYLEVLDLQRSSFNSQLKASEALQLQLSSTVRLYSALGGGWVAEQDSLQLGIE